MANDKQAFLMGFLFGATFALIGLATWFPIKPQLVAPLWYNPAAPQCPELQPSAVERSSFSREAGQTPRGEKNITPVSEASPARERERRASQVTEKAPVSLLETSSLPLGVRADERENNPNGKFLIYTCRRDTRWCGGWSDRQKGMVNAFLLALVTNRRFGIKMTTPCDVRKLYVPNEYNWIVRDQDIEGNKTKLSIRSIDKATSFQADLFTMDFNARYPQDVIFLTTNNEHHKAIIANPLYRKSLPLWARQSMAQLFHDAWHTLMKPSPLLQQRMDSFLTRSLHFVTRTKPLVGLHVRVGTSASLKDTEVRVNNFTTLGR